MYSANFIDLSWPDVCHGCVVLWLPRVGNQHCAWYKENFCSWDFSPPTPYINWNILYIWTKYLNALLFRQMRTWSWVWAVELISIHWNIFTYLMCVHWDYANHQVCLHIWGNSLLSPEWLGNLLVRLPETLTELLLGWGANLGRARLFFIGNVWDLVYHVFHTNNSQTKPYKGYCSHRVIHFYIFSHKRFRFYNSHETIPVFSLLYTRGGDDLWRLKGTIAKACEQGRILLQNWPESMLEKNSIENNK